MTWSPGKRIAIRLLSHLSPQPYRSGFGALSRALRESPDHPIVRFDERIRREVDPAARKLFFRNVIMRWLLAGWKMRRHDPIPFPPVLLISVTDSCNYRCRGCYAAGHEKGHEMDPALVDRLINESKAHGANYFVILGGEPFLWPHLIPMFKRHPDAYFQIYTNGSRIDREMARELRQAANVQVMISLEGLRDSTDSRRGEGAYDACMNAMDNLRAERMPFGAGITVYRSNLDEVLSDGFVQEMIGRGCLYLWYFQYMPYGDLPELDQVLSPGDRRRLHEGIIRIRNSYPVIAADQIADCVPVGGCSVRAGMALHVTASGMVEPCAQMHFSDCSVMGRSIEVVIRQSDFLRGLRTPAADSSRACFLQDCCEDLRQAIEASGAHDNTGGRDTESLSVMASRAETGAEQAPVDDAYQPLVEFFFEMLRPSWKLD